MDSEGRMVAAQSLGLTVLASTFGGKVCEHSLIQAFLRVCVLARRCVFLLTPRWLTDLWDEERAQEL